MQKNEVTYTKTRNPGEVMEVDYAGKSCIITHDGEEVECEMLVCVPYSNLIYCEAQLNQRQESYKWVYELCCILEKET